MGAERERRKKEKKREEREEERRREREEREKRERREREDDDDDVHGDDSDKRGRRERRTGLSLPCRWCSTRERVCSLFLNLKLEWLRSRHEDHQREQRDPNEKFSWKFASDAEVSFPERFVAFEWRERANERELLVRSS